MSKKTLHSNEKKRRESKSIDDFILSTFNPKKKHCKRNGSFNYMFYYYYPSFQFLPHTGYHVPKFQSN
jgi:hypothetical protein